MENIYELRPGEKQDEYLYRLGCLKDSGAVQITWPELSEILNKTVRQYAPPMDPSSWRKRFRRLQIDPPKLYDDEEDVIQDPEAPLVPEPEPYPVKPPAPALEDLAAIRRERALIQDARTSGNRVMREAARATSLQEIMQQQIVRFEPEFAPPAHKAVKNSRALYAMLSDIHYGIEFANAMGVYNSDIAQERVMRYADELIHLGVANNIDTIFVSLMGDMVSGIIHQTIRLENRENLVEQIVGVSELTAEFLHRLSMHFNMVYVNSVPGNHSRIDKSFDDATRGEKVDTLIVWYCKSKLENIYNVEFCDNKYDPTVGVFEIFGKTYVSVHGDLDQDLRTSASRIRMIIGGPIDYILAGHLHVPDCRFEHVGYIRNGSVCGSGDEYTAKKRLYSPPYQVAMIVSKYGVDSLHPFRLDIGEVQE